ncbi:MAG: rhodanese-like domain-containing protein [Methanotrichaceae archaeon]
MILGKTLLCTALLLCLAVQAYSQPYPGSPSITYADPAINEMQQSLEGFKNVYQGTTDRPQASASVSGDQTFKSGFPDYTAKANDFLNEVDASNYYAVTVPEFINRTKIDTAWVIVDIRPARTYAAGHIQNAINVPISNLISMMGTIPASKKIAVCGTTNTEAAFGVMALTLFGNREAYVLLDGVQAWQQSGMHLVS